MNLNKYINIYIYIYAYVWQEYIRSFLLTTKANPTNKAKAATQTSEIKQSSMLPNVLEHLGAANPQPQTP